MEYTIIYHSAVVQKDIPKLSSDWKQKIRLAIETKLAVHPEIFGKPLRRSLKGYRTMRVWNYRVIFRIEQKTIKIFAIQPRDFVYAQIQKRI